MPLTAGARLGPYEVVAPLGAGGMGEVYRARDPRLERDVAIKILPPLVAADPERLSRFEREAKTLASLNHPNIAHIHGLVELPAANGAIAAPALVMELVEGEDLAQRLQRGAIPLDEALDIGRQIADALEAAHEQGIIHRDLKPANVKLRPDGTVKVLDFGLAKAMEISGPVGQMNSPTFTSPATQSGVILGTAAYMAPEQAKGKPVDRRADIWAFGVLLHEMITGTQLWVGETVAETLAHVLTREPELGSLPATTPLPLRQLIARCLVKDTRARLRDIGEARVTLTDLIAGYTAPPDTPDQATGARRRAAWALAATATVAALAFAALWLLKTPAIETPPLRAALEPPAGRSFGSSFALSPDGTRLVFDAYGPDDEKPVLWLRDLSTGTAAPIKNTDDGWRPFWSPDGRHLAFFADGKLKRIDLQGGSAQVLADAPTGRGGTWTPEGRIIFAAEFRGGLQIMDARGGAATPLSTPSGDETSHRWPAVLPDGKHVLFLSQTSEGGTRDDTSSIDIVAVDGSGRRKLVTANSSPIYVDPGFLLFWRDGTLLAQRMDPSAAQLSGDPFPVAHDVAYDQNEMAMASVSGGRLVFQPGRRTGDAVVTWIDRTGKTQGAITEPGSFECGLDLSPDATRIVVGSTRPGTNGCDLWLYDVGRGVPTRLTFDDRNEYAPRFSADGGSIFYGGDTGRDMILRQVLDGRSAPEVILESSQEGASFIQSGVASRNGRWMVVTSIGTRTGSDVMRYDLAEKRVSPLVQTPFNETSPALSPDERHLAYASDRSGRFEVYVEPIGRDGEVWRVSANGGTLPQWRRDGRELFFIVAPDRITSADVLPGEVFRTSPQRELFRAPFAFGVADYAATADGQRFVAPLSAEPHSRQALTIISEWRPR